MRDHAMSTLETLEALAARYVRAIGPGDAPMPRGRGVHVVNLEWELIQLWLRFPDASVLVGQARAATTPRARRRAAELAARVRRASAWLWKARGRVAKRMARHPDVLQPLRHAVAALKEALRDETRWAPAPSLAA